MIPVLGKPVPLEVPKALLGEAPIWHHNALWWVDIERGMLYRHTPADGACEVAQFLDTVGFIIPREEKGWIAGIGRCLVWLDEDARIKSSQCLPTSANVRCNDAKADEAGRLWIGTMARDAGPGLGKLYRLDPDGSVNVILCGLGISNGMTWSLDSRRFYFIDSHRPEIAMFSYNAGAGTLGERAVLAEIKEGIPDGMTMDSAGHLWVALWGGFCVLRIDGDSGQILGRIPLPVPHVTNCAFGGPDGSSLFITTASIALSTEARARYPDAGLVYYVKLPGITGSSIYSCKL